MIELDPGYPALIILLLTTLLSTLICISSTPIGHTGGIRWFLTESPPHSRAAFTGIVATTFWIWAVWKVVTNGARDLGVFSFAMVMISCLWVYRQRDSSNGMVIPSRLLLASSLLVAANYLMVYFVYNVPWTFQMYLYVGVVYWAVVAGWNWRGYGRWRDDQQDEKDTNATEEETPYIAA